MDLLLRLRVRRPGERPDQTGQEKKEGDKAGRPILDKYFHAH